MGRCRELLFLAEPRRAVARFNVRNGEFSLLLVKPSHLEWTRAPLELHGKELLTHLYD